MGKTVVDNRESTIDNRHQYTRISAQAALPIASIRVLHSRKFAFKKNPLVAKQGVLINGYLKTEIEYFNSGLFSCFRFCYCCQSPAQHTHLVWHYSIGKRYMQID